MIAFLFKVWALARPYRGRMLLGVTAGLISGFLEPLAIATFTFVFQLIFSPGTRPLRDRIKGVPGFVQSILPRSLWDWLEAARQSLASDVKGRHTVAVVGLVALIPLVMLLRGLFSYLNIYLLQWAAFRAITDLRIRLFEHLINLSASFFNKMNTGELMSRISNDTAQLSNVISNATAVIVKDPATLLGLLIYLLLEQPKLTLISMLVMPMCTIPIIFFNRKVRRSAGSLQTHYAEISSLLSESFGGNRIVKAYNLEHIVVEQFRVLSRKMIGHYIRIVRAQEIPGALLELFGAFGLSLVFLYLAFQAGERRNYADFLGMLLAIFSMYRPLKNLARLQSNLEQARAASARVFELLAERNTIPEPAKPKTFCAAGKDVRFERVGFAYGEKEVLSEIDLTVKAGQLVALVGASGSGKTTLTHLLVRFYDPKHGSVRIGETDIREVSTRELRNQIAMVTQETVLFDETISRNIELGRPGACDAEIETAARQARAHDFIIDKPQRYKTVIGERGVNLSGGQRQRIAIARAILKNAPILVLDEATSALDTESERAVQAALEGLMQGRTTICIAHRLSTIQKADVIVVLEHGRIVETGQHNELLKRKGTYHRLYELQFQA